MNEGNRTLHEGFPSFFEDNFGGINASKALIGQQLSFVETKMASDDEDVPGLFIFNTVFGLIQNSS